MTSSEKNLTKAITNYIKFKYTEAIFKVDLASDQKLTKQQAYRNSQLLGKWSRGHPDLVLYEARGGYHGLFIEIKTEKATPFKKNGELKKSEHLGRQEEFMRKLRGRGYYAVFGVGLNECKRVIDEYMAQKATAKP